MEKWALWLFVLMLLLLFAGTWYVKYPDLVQTNAFLTGNNAPKEIVARQDGKLVRLFVANDSAVAQGQMVAWLESTASHAEVLKLSALVEKSTQLLASNQTENVSAMFENIFGNLGELQPGYQQFITALQQFNDYLINGYYYKRKQVLFEDLAFLQKMTVSLVQQKVIMQQDIQLTQEAFDANSKLYQDKVISKQDFRDQKAKLLGKQMSMPQIDASLLTNENAQTAKKKEIDELEHAISLQKNIFRQALQTFKSLTDDWKRKFIISAPVAGKIVFIVPLQENQFLQSGKTLGYVNPVGSRYYAQVTLPQANFGKIDTGERVQLRFVAYPYQEFGYVEGRLDYISKVPSDSGFLANISLPKGLITNYNKAVQYRSGLKCQALIITKDARLLQRFYYNIVKWGQR